MNLFEKSNFNCVFSSSLDWFHSSGLSEGVEKKINRFCRETESFYPLCSHRKYSCYARGGFLPSRPSGRGVSTYNSSDNLGYIRGLNGKQKQLIKKLVHICMIDGKKTRSRAIVYKTFHRLAPHGDVIKLLVNAIENVKPICGVKKVRISGITRLVPSITA
jgi:hypothetical protein